MLRLACSKMTADTTTLPAGDPIILF